MLHIEFLIYSHKLDLSGKVSSFILACMFGNFRAPRLFFGQTLRSPRRECAVNQCRWDRYDETRNRLTQQLGCSHDRKSLAAEFIFRTLKLLFFQFYEFDFLLGSSEL